MKLAKYMAMVMVVLLCACGTRIKDSELSNVTMPSEKHLSARPRVALVLGGGGNRGAAHAGVIHVLAKAGIPVDLLVGTSAGSLAAVLYADDPTDPDGLVQRAQGVSDKDVIDFSIFNLLSDPVDGSKLQAYLREHLRSQSFEDLKIKTVAVATDLQTTQSFAIGSGPIAPAVNASCAVPKVFRPVKLYGHVLVDGGMAATVPVAIAEKYNPQLIIAVNVSPDALEPGRKDSFAQHIPAQKAALKRADVLILPDVGSYSAFDDKHNPQLVAAGEKAATEALPRIKALLAKKGIAMRPQYRSW